MFSTALPPNELNHRQFPVEASRVSLLDLVPIVEKKAGKIELVHISVEEALIRYKTKGMFLEWIKAMWALGKGTPGTQVEVDECRALFKDWNPKPVQAFI